MPATKSVTVINRHGIHCRPSAMIAKAVSQFPNCEISLSKEGEKVSATDILGIMTLDLSKGCSITVIANGQDEEKACETIAALISSEFDFDR